MPNHRLIEYPEFDMQNLTIKNSGFDLVIHSDTLEHVPNPEKGLSECLRMLNPDGKCIFTVPIVVDRFTRTRVGLKPSYHGCSGIAADDQVVCTEFGSDFWKTAVKAGFSRCEIYVFEYPAAMALICKK
jgi:ubiquinone/menaquinone biosynthesis C-methylase UbiE